MIVSDSLKKKKKLQVFGRVKHLQIFTAIISNGVPNLIQPCDYFEIGKQGKENERKIEHSEHTGSHGRATETLVRHPLTT